MTKLSKISIDDLKSDHSSIKKLLEIMKKYDHSIPKFTLSQIETELGRRTLIND